MTQLLPLSCRIETTRLFSRPRGREIVQCRYRLANGLNSQR